jgi:hypothetical protein
MAMSRFSSGWADSGGALRTSSSARALIRLAAGPMMRGKRDVALLVVPVHLEHGGRGAG